MITIKRGNEEFKVSKGSYELIYKELGFEIVKENKAQEEVKVIEEPKKNEEEPKKVEPKQAKNNKKAGGK